MKMAGVMPPMSSEEIPPAQSPPPEAARTALCSISSSSPHRNRYAGLRRGPQIFFQKKTRKRAVHGPKE